MNLFRRISKILFFLSLTISLSIGLSFLFGFSGIINVITYCLISNSFTLLFFVLMMQLKSTNKTEKIITIPAILIGFSIWNLGLFQVIDFPKTWNTAFLLMIFSFILTLFFETTKLSSVMMKFFTGFSAMMLLFVIFFTSQSLFENSILLISSLVLFTLFSGISYFFARK